MLLGSAMTGVWNVDEQFAAAAVWQRATGSNLAPDSAHRLGRFHLTNRSALLLSFAAVAAALPSLGATSSGGWRMLGAARRRRRPDALPAG